MWEIGYFPPKTQNKTRHPVSSSSEVLSRATKQEKEIIIHTMKEVNFVYVQATQSLEKEKVREVGSWRHGLVLKQGALPAPTCRLQLCESQHPVLMTCAGTVHIHINKFRFSKCGKIYKIEEQWAGQARSCETRSILELSGSLYTDREQQKLKLKQPVSATMLAPMKCMQLGMDLTKFTTFRLQPVGQCQKKPKTT